MENQNNQNVSHIEPIESVPALQQAFVQTMPSNLLKRLDERHFANQKKQDYNQKSAKADEIRSLKVVEMIQKGEEKRNKIVKAQIIKSNGGVDPEKIQQLKEKIEQKQSVADEFQTQLLIHRISKAQEHNQKVQEIVQNARQNNDKEISQDRLSFENKQAEAQSRRDKAMEEKLQKAMDSQMKFKFDPEQRALDVKQLKQQQIHDKQQQAEMRRQEMISQRLKKVKESQKKYFAESNRKIKDTKIRSNSIDNREIRYDDLRETSDDIQQAILESLKQNEESNQSEAPKQPVAFQLNQDIEESKSWEVIKDNQPEKQEEPKQNMDVSMPVNISMQVPKTVNEPQQTSMNQQKVMYVGGNKITFSVNININIEPMDS